MRSVLDVHGSAISKSPDPAEGRRVAGHRDAPARTGITLLPTVAEERCWHPPWVPPLLRDRIGVGRTLFLSDLHLGAGPDPIGRETDLRALLASLPGNIDDLVLGGDLFEFWWEWREAVPRRHLEVLLSLRETASRGVRLHLVAGNHDFRVGDFLGEFLPARIHPDGICLDLGGPAWLALHGDGMARGDGLDRLVRKVLRSPVAQRLWNLLPPDFAFAVAGGVGKTSRRVNPGPAPNLEQYRQAALEWIREHHLAGVVHGHTHRPHLERLGRGLYINNGDWVERRTAVWLPTDGAARLVDCRKEGHPWRSNI